MSAASLAGRTKRKAKSVPSDRPSLAGPIVGIVLSFLGAVGAVVLHAFHPAGVYSIVTHASDGLYVTRVQAATANAANHSVDFLAISLLVACLIALFFSVLAVCVAASDYEQDLQGLAMGLFAAVVACLLFASTYHSLGYNQHEERTDQVQTQVDKWIASELHVPNNYHFLDNKPYVEHRAKGGDDVVVERTEGDFVKSYSSRTTEGTAIKFTITRVGDTYTVRVVQ